MSSPGKKKILIVSRSFFPENSPRSFRTTELVKEFARQGHNVTLLTVRNPEFHDPLERKLGINIIDFGRLRGRLIDITRGGRISKFFRRGLRRILQVLLEYPDIELMFRARSSIRGMNGFDLLISVAVPHPVHWGVAWAWSEKGGIARTWVADCGDPFMGNVFDRFRKPFYFKYFEKWFCREADFISIPRIEMAVNFYPEFRNKMREIPQGINFESVKTFNGKLNNPVPTFGFAGTFIRRLRDPHQLLKYLSESDKEFHFIVYTRTPEHLLPFMPALGNRLEIRDYISREELIYELSRMDFLVNIGYDPSKQAPSKLIDYYLAGRPILHIPSEGLNTETIKQFLSGDYTSGFKVNNAEEFRIERICSKFLELIVERERK